MAAPNINERNIGIEGLMKASLKLSISKNYLKNYCAISKNYCIISKLF